MISCQVCWRIMRWHNGRTRRSLNPNSEEVLQDCVTNGERSAAHSILARSQGSNKGRIHLRRPKRHSHFPLAERRRTIHYELPTTRPQPSIMLNAGDESSATTTSFAGSRVRFSIPFGMPWSVDQSGCISWSVRILLWQQAARHSLLGAQFRRRLRPW
jgi:hypothetical protein